MPSATLSLAKVQASRPVQVIGGRQLADQEGAPGDHPGYEKNDPAGRNGGNSRHGHRAKTALTNTVPMEISCRGPRCQLA